MPTTLADVAALAGVSVKTVSRVVNREPGVSSRTRQRVEVALARTGYVPDAAARALRTGRTGTIGLAVPELAQPFFAELADRVAAAARREGLGVVLGVTGEHGEHEARFLQTALGLDGVIMYWQGLSDTAITTERTHRPVVLLGEDEIPGIDSIGMDNGAGVALALDHLLAIGRERIAVVGAPVVDAPPHGAARFRWAALQQAVAERGIELDPALVVRTTRWHRPEGARAASEILARGGRPDAVLAFNDALALGVLRGRAEAGARVPDDIAVTGFDDVQEARYASPSLTTVTPHLTAYAESAVNLLTDRLAGASGPARTVRQDVDLLPRDSTLGGAG